VKVSIEVSRSAAFGFKNGEIIGHGNANYLRRGKLRAALGKVAKHASPALCIQKEHDFAVFAADIASQGHDAIYVYDAAGNGHCVTGLEQVKSIRAMNKHLGSTLPVRTMETIQGRKGKPPRRTTVIRPFIKAEHGIRCFVVSGTIVAATAHRADAYPGEQVVPFINEVGSKLVEARTGCYKTHFKESYVSPALFERFLEKANAVVTDLKEADEYHYVMDILMDAKGNYAVDIYDLASAEYFALSPSVVANAILTIALGDMLPDRTYANRLEVNELTQLANLFADENVQLRYTGDKMAKDQDDIFGDDIGWFPEVFSNTVTIRDLLHTADDKSQSILDEDGTWLATHLVIPEIERNQYDLSGFAAAIRQDFHARFPGNVDALKNKGDLFHLVPLLDAARWYKGRNAQTWRYCASNDSDEHVTVRPIDPGLNRSEQRLNPKLPSLARSDSERSATDAFSGYDAEAHSTGLMNFIMEVDDQLESAADDEKVAETFDFLCMLLEDDEE